MAEQMTARYRQAVVLPLNDETVEEFQAGRASSASMARAIRMTPDLMADVWTSGIFRAINAACDSLIDEYEEEELSGDQLPRAIKCVETFPRTTEFSTLPRFAVELREMLMEAQGAGRPVFFVM